MLPKEPASNPSFGQALPPGTRLEEFVIEQVLGSGGFGITYLAQDSRLGRQVVIKENLPAQFCWRDVTSLTVQPRQSSGEDADNFQYSLESFEKEAAMLASLDHPGIVKVLRSFEANGTAYFVMPFVEGSTFDEVMRGRQAQSRPFAKEDFVASGVTQLISWNVVECLPFTEAELGKLLDKVLTALTYLHERGIYHRDIKPGNLLITSQGDPVLIDFGAARQRLSERSLTVIESPGYTPFEQMQSRGKVGPWSDLYALGGTLYKAITGETPAKAEDRAFDDPVVPLVERSELKGRFSQRLLQSIDFAMRPNLSERLQSAEEWLGLFLAKDPTPPSTPADADADAEAAGRHEGSDLTPVLASSIRGIRRGTYLIALLCFLFVCWVQRRPTEYGEIWLFLALIGLVGATYKRIENWMGVGDALIAFLVIVPLIGIPVVMICMSERRFVGEFRSAGRKESAERDFDPYSIEWKFLGFGAAAIGFAVSVASFRSLGLFLRSAQSLF